MLQNTSPTRNKCFCANEARNAGALDSVKKWNDYVEKMAQKGIEPGKVALSIAEKNFPEIKGEIIL